MKLLLLPSWVLVRLMTPFLPSNHPFKNKKFTLDEWLKGSTNITMVLSILLWSNFLCLLFLLIFLNSL